MRCAGWFVAGAVVLACYSLFLNSSNVDFGKRSRTLYPLRSPHNIDAKEHQSPTKPIYLGGAFTSLADCFFPWARNRVDWNSRSRFPQIIGFSLGRTERRMTKTLSTCTV